MMTMPPPRGGGRITQGWTEDPKLLTLPAGPLGRHGSTASLSTLFLVAIFVVIVIIVILALSLLLPSSAVGSGLLHPTAPPLLPPPDPNQSMPIELSCLALCTTMPNRTTNPATAPHNALCILVVTAIVILPPTAAAAAWGRTTASASPVTKLGGGGGYRA